MREDSCFRFDMFTFPIFSYLQCWVVGTYLSGTFSTGGHFWNVLKMVRFSLKLFKDSALMPRTFLSWCVNNWKFSEFVYFYPKRFYLVRFLGRFLADAFINCVIFGWNFLQLRRWYLIGFLVCMFLSKTFFTLRFRLGRFQVSAFFNLSVFAWNIFF